MHLDPAGPPGETYDHGPKQGHGDPPPLVETPPENYPFDVPPDILSWLSGVSPDPVFEKIFYEFIEPDVYEHPKAPAPSASPFTVKCTHCEDGKDGSDKHGVLCQDGGGGEIERVVPEPAYANPFQPLPLPNHHQIGRAHV